MMSSSDYARSRSSGVGDGQNESSSPESETSEESCVLIVELVEVDASSGVMNEMVPEDIAVSKERDSSLAEE